MIIRSLYLTTTINNYDCENSKDVEDIIRYTNRDIRKMEENIRRSIDEIKKFKVLQKEVMKMKFKFISKELDTFFYNKNYNSISKLPPPLPEFLLPDYIYFNAPKIEPIDRIKFLRNTLNLPTELSNMIIYKNNGLQTPTAKIIKNMYYKLSKEYIDKIPWVSNLGFNKNYMPLSNIYYERRRRLGISYKSLSMINKLFITPAKSIYLLSNRDSIVNLLLGLRFYKSIYWYNSKIKSNTKTTLFLEKYNKTYFFPLEDHILNWCSRYTKIELVEKFFEPNDFTYKKSWTKKRMLTEYLKMD